MTLFALFGSSRRRDCKRNCVNLLERIKYLKEAQLALDKEELKKPLKETGVKSLDDFNAFKREISKKVVETLLEGGLTDHLGYEKHDRKAKAAANS
jgi:hypothetical protein